MKRFLITGVSSGIGRALAKDLVLGGNEVWGIARRKELLQSLDDELRGRGKFCYSVADVAREKDWENLITKMSREKYFPEVVIFNAAIYKPDLEKGLEVKLIKETFAVNFFGIIQGLEFLLDFVKRKTQFLAISSLSALKGSAIEGIGYPASKAALSVAFESFHQKYGGKFTFKTLYFGPIATGMSHFEKSSLFVISESRAVKAIEECLVNNKEISYYPWFLFLVIKLMKLLPSNIYFSLLSKIERQNQRYVD